jgi:hypothetical protein
VSWSKVCSPIAEGGLGVRNLLLFNRALLEEWLWCYAFKREALWRVVVDCKYGSLWNGWPSGEVNGLHGVVLWKFIGEGWGEFSSHTSLEVGDGSKVRF